MILTSLEDTWTALKSLSLTMMISVLIQLILTVQVVILERARVEIYLNPALLKSLFLTDFKLYDLKQTDKRRTLKKK